MQHRTALLITAVLVALIAVAGQILSGLLHSSRFLALAVVLVGVVTFFGILLMQLNERGQRAFSERAMRLAITAALVVAYITLVGTTVFFGEGYGRMPQLADTVLGSFTTVVGLVMAFYFGTSAYVEGREKKSESGGEKKDETRPDVE
jgi:hypothetical protein